MYLVIGIIFIIFVYLLIGNIIVRWMDRLDLIEIEEQEYFFMLGMIFPLVILYAIIHNLTKSITDV